MKLHYNFILVALLSTIFLGCANVTAIPVNAHSKVSGIRIYEVKPLLVISGANTSLLMVPNYNRAYALQFSSFLAKHDFEAEFQNGFISKIKSNQDTTAIAEALIQLVQEAVKSGSPIGEAFSVKADGGTVNRFGVYDIVFSEDGELIGLKPLVMDSSLIKVPNGVRASVAPVVGGKKDLN